MKRLSKAQVEDKSKHQEALSKAFEDFQTKLEDFMTVQSEEWSKVEAAAEKYNDLVHDANEWLDGLRSDAESYQSERSDKWQESEAGEQYGAWIEALSHEVERIELDPPTDPDMPDDGSEAFGEIPEAPDEV